ncbi:PPC domain-containing protein [Isosphaeraceae bacterium EP7]
MRHRLALLSGVSLILLAATHAQAASPGFSAIRPVGAQRGVEIEVNLTGARLIDAKEVVFHEPGISVTKLTVVNDGHVKAMFKISPDARLGLYDLRVRSATGVSELRTFSVGPYKDVAEVEPNNDFAKPQVIALGTCVNGVAETEDVDYFAVEAKKGQRISAEVEGNRGGISAFDPYVGIINAKRFELSTSDDLALIWQDGFASITAPEDGTYLIQVRESAYAGNAACLYRVHIGDFPRFTATIPAGGKPGEKLAVKWIGDVLGEKTTEVTMPATADRNFGLLAQDDKGVSPYPNMFRLSALTNVLEVEPNDNHGIATKFTAPGALNGVIEKPGDEDHFVFDAKKGQVFDVRVFARTLRSPLDPVLFIGKKGQGALVGNDDNPGPDSYIRFTAPDDGEYVIWVVDHLKKGSPDSFYRIEIAPVEAKLVISPAVESLQRGAGHIAAVVPRGNRYAILLNAARNDFGGDLKFEALNLPPGVTFEADAMNAAIATMPVLFTATADAAPAGSLAAIRGKPVDPKVIVPDEFTHTVDMVLGQNQIPVWTRTVDNMAVAVTDECPYSIEIVEPKVPLVRGGSMNLKVIAKRKEGFTAPIAVSLPWNPPGVSSSGGIVIPEKGTEALIPINADGGSPLTTWKIVVNGYSGIATGPIYVSSQLAKLSVAAPYVALTYQSASVEQGKEVDMLVKVAKAADWDGPAQITLIGLPNKAVTEVKSITKDSTDLIFKIKTDAATPAGNHANLFCQVVITQAGEPIVHNIGTGTLRVDAPLPAKPNAPAPVAAAATPAPAPAAAPPKPLTRLEKLRKEHAERAKAAAAEPGPAPAPAPATASAAQ